MDGVLQFVADPRPPDPEANTNRIRIRPINHALTFNWSNPPMSGFRAAIMKAARLAVPAIAVGGVAAWPAGRRQQPEPLKQVAELP
jgi:hypothetical protein